MKLFSRIIASTGIVFTAFTIPVLAGGEGLVDEEKSGIYFSFGAGISSLLDVGADDVSDIYIRTTKNYDDNLPVYSVAIGYDFGRFRTEFNYQKDSFEANNYMYRPSSFQELSINEDLHLSTISANIFYDFNNKSKLTPYVGTGIGSTKVERMNGNIRGIPQPNHDDTKTSLTLKLGISYEMTKSSDVFLETTYLRVYDIKLGLANLDDIESYAVQVGMRFSL